MIRIIDHENRERFVKSMDQYYRLRHEVFVRELQWRDSSDGHSETDEYDNRHTVYLLSIDASDDVAGFMRLYPTTLPYMLLEHFGHLIDGAPLQRPDVMEASRYAIARDRRNAGIYHELFLGMLEYCLAEGVVGTTAMMRTMKIPLLHSIGMSVRPLGLSQEVSGEQNTAVYYDMSEEVLTRVRKSAGIRHSVLERNGAIAPVTELPITALAPSRMQ